MPASDRMTFLGVNHVALVCRDMAETVQDFYENVLGMPLVKTLELPGDGQNFFFDCGGGATLAFMWFKNAPPAAPTRIALAARRCAQGRAPRAPSPR